MRSQYGRNWACDNTGAAMTKRESDRKARYDLATGIRYILVLLAMAIGGPIIAWWNSFPPEGHVILIVGAVALFVVGLALLWV